MDDLVERLRGHLRFAKLPSWVRADLPIAADRIEAQAAEIRSLREQVAQERAGREAATLAGIAMGLEAAARAVRDEVYAEARDTEWDTGFNYAKKLSGSMILHIDPAAILAAHTRAEALSELAEADGVLIWDCPLSHPDCKSNCGSYGCGN